MHTPEEIEIDSFQSDRSPDKRYDAFGPLVRPRKRGGYHDGRFETLGDVVHHYDSHLNTGLNSQEVSDLVEFLRSL